MTVLEPEGNFRDWGLAWGSVSLGTISYPQPLPIFPFQPVFVLCKSRCELLSSSKCFALPLSHRLTCPKLMTRMHPFSLKLVCHSSIKLTTMHNFDHGFVNHSNRNPDWNTLSLSQFSLSMGSQENSKRIIEMPLWLPDRLVVILACQILHLLHEGYVPGIIKELKELINRDINLI